MECHCSESICLYIPNTLHLKIIPKCIPMPLIEAHLRFLMKQRRDVSSSHPRGEEAPKGQAVRLLKWYVSRVQYVVKQYGSYLLLVILN